MIGEFNKSVILTYIGACCSVLGIVLCMQDEFVYAMLCMVVAGICDLFDGVVARKCKRSKDAMLFGVQIDSLTDMISFVAFPCVAGFVLMKPLPFLTPVLMVYTLCGIIRLAWYNVHTAQEGDVRHFTGLPVTYSALIIPVAALFRGFVAPNAFAFITAGVFLIMSLFFVLKLRIIKPRGVWYGLFGILAIAVVILTLVLGV